MSDLVDDVVPLLSSPDRSIRFTAAEIVACHSDRSPQLFSRLTRLFEDDDRAVRGRAAELATKATAEQIAAAREYETHHDSSSLHASGLRLLDRAGSADAEAIKAISSENPIVRTYAAVYAKRAGGEALRTAIELNRDEDLALLLTRDD